ncbi:MAG: hypothetical protein Fur0041_02810 [Bacteroidia bacterium]
MNNIRHITPLLFALLIAVLTGCESNVKFENAQPKGIPALKEIPASLQGVYYGDTDSLYIQKTTIILARTKPHEMLLSDSAQMGLHKNNKGKYVFPTGSNRSVTKVSNDTVYFNSRFVQNYKLGKDTVLKSWNNAYWLSTKRAEDTLWSVMHITLHKNKLTIAIPSIPSDEYSKMQTRMNLEKVNSDSCGMYSLIVPFTRPKGEDRFLITDPGPEQLKNLDKKGLFRPVGAFIKVK